MKKLQKMFSTSLTTSGSKYAALFYSSKENNLLQKITLSINTNQ